MNFNSFNSSRKTSGITGQTKVYEIYQNSPTSGNKTFMDSVNARSPKEALNKYLENRRVKKGKFLVIPHSVRSKYTFVK